jgi:hypothetical protein
LLESFFGIILAKIPYKFKFLRSFENHKKIIKNAPQTKIEENTLFDGNLQKGAQLKWKKVAFS